MSRRLASIKESKQFKNQFSELSRQDPRITVSSVARLLNTNYGFLAGRLTSEAPMLADQVEQWQTHLYPELKKRVNATSSLTGQKLMTAVKDQPELSNLGYSRSFVTKVIKGQATRASLLGLYEKLVLKLPPILPVVSGTSYAGPLYRPLIASAKRLNAMGLTEWAISKAAFGSKAKLSMIMANSNQRYFRAAAVKKIKHWQRSLQQLELAANQANSLLHQHHTWAGIAKALPGLTATKANHLIQEYLRSSAHGLQQLTPKELFTIVAIAIYRN